MSNSASSSSVTGGSLGFTSVLTSTLSLPRYHFKAGSTLDLSHGENVDIVHGWRVSTQEPVVAKVAVNSLRLEREFYVMKKLYHYSDGPSFLGKFQVLLDVVIFFFSCIWIIFVNSIETSPTCGIYQAIKRLNSSHLCRRRP